MAPFFFTPRPPRRHVIQYQTCRFFPQQSYMDGFQSEFRSRLCALQGGVSPFFTAVPHGSNVQKNAFKEEFAGRGHAACKETPKIFSTTQLPVRLRPETGLFHPLKFGLTPELQQKSHNK